MNIKRNGIVTLRNGYKPYQTIPNHTKRNQMSKKHFNQAAEYIKGLLESKTIKKPEAERMVYLIFVINDNPNFNLQRFREAAGL